MNTKRLLKAIGKAFLFLISTGLLCTGIVYIGEHFTPNEMATAALILAFIALVAWFYFTTSK